MSLASYPLTISRLECRKWVHEKLMKKLVNHFFLSVVFHIKSLKNNNIMETKENLMQSMSEKQNEVVTEKFIADFALIDASVVQKKLPGI